MVQAVLAAGLWPAAGIHHDNVRNSWCLVDDLMETLRPAVDAAAGSLLVSGARMEDPETRHALVGVLSEKFDRTGASVLTVGRDVASSYSLYVAGSGEFAPAGWDGEVPAYGQGA
jgi:CRISPR/Cas system-associated endonuclease Cas1